MRTNLFFLERDLLFLLFCIYVFSNSAIWNVGLILVDLRSCMGRNIIYVLTPNPINNEFWFQDGFNKFLIIWPSPERHLTASSLLTFDQPASAQPWKIWWTKSWILVLIHLTFLSQRLIQVRCGVVIRCIALYCIVYNVLDKDFMTSYCNPIKFQHVLGYLDWSLMSSR